MLDVFSESRQALLFFFEFSLAGVEFHPLGFGFAQLGADAEGRQLVMPAARHAIGLAAEQDVDDLPGAEPLVPLPVQPHDGGQQLLRGHRAVPHLRRRQARVAVGAGSSPFGKVSQQLRAAAVRRLAQREHRVQVRRQPPPVREVAVGTVDQPPLLHHVGEAVGEPRGRGQPVAAGPARLRVNFNGEA